MSLSVVSDSTDHTIEKIYDNSNENYGNYYAKCIISGTYGELFECTTSNFDLPKDQQVYLEMDYKSNAPIMVGMYANGISLVEKNIIMYLNKKDDWNKIYISLTEAIYNYNDAINYKLFCNSRDTTLTQNEMYLDNIDYFMKNNILHTINILLQIYLAHLAWNFFMYYRMDYLQNQYS